MRPTQAPRDPVFWWWDEDSGARVGLLTDSVFVLSGLLEKRQLAALERARLAGNVLDGDLGPDAIAVALSELVQVRYIQPQRRVLLFTNAGVACAVQLPKASGAIAVGIFDILTARFSDAELVGKPGVADPRQRKTSPVQAMVTLGVVGLVCLGLAGVASEAPTTSGRFAPLRQSMNDLFVRLGYGPAIAVFVVMAAIQIWLVVTTPGPDASVEDGTQILDLRDATDPTPPQVSMARPLGPASAPAPPVEARQQERGSVDPRAPRPAWASES